MSYLDKDYERLLAIEREKGKPSALYGSLIVWLFLGACIAGLLFRSAYHASERVAELDAESFKHRNFQRVEGEIVKVAALRPDRHDLYNHGHASYCPKVSYGYEFAGEQWVFSEISLVGVDCYAELKDSEEFVKRYKVGVKVSVFVDTDQPKLGYLNTEDDFEYRS